MLAVRFRVRGLLRFLSHAEMLRVFQRACARSGVEVKHTAGFNPHPRLSLPLPRTVGVESDDELFVARLSDEPADGPESLRRACEARVRESLREALPAGIDVIDVKLTLSSASVQGRSADYVFPLRPDRSVDRADTLGERIRAVLASERLVVERKRPGDRIARHIDVRPFLESIQVAGDCVTVRCRVTPTGSIRIDEIMQLLELSVEDLVEPIRRTAVEWGSTPPPQGEEDKTRGKPPDRG